MGVNICLIDAANVELPHDQWDWSLNGGAKQLFRMMGAELGVVQLGDDDVHEVRPDDIDAWRVTIAESDIANTEMYLRMLDTLEARPDVRIYVSY